MRWKFSYQWKWKNERKKTFFFQEKGGRGWKWGRREIWENGGAKRQALKNYPIISTALHENWLKITEIDTFCVNLWQFDTLFCSHNPLEVNFSRENFSPVHVQQVDKMSRSDEKIFWLVQIFQIFRSKNTNFSLKIP